MNKTIGYIGLGKMGSGMVARLVEKEWQVVTYDPDHGAREEARRAGTIIADSPQSVVSSLTPPRLLWIMVPQNAIEGVLDEIIPALEPGDTVIDGGNTFYKDSVRRATSLKERHIHFLDVGVSGGPRGAREGACMMVGGGVRVYGEHTILFDDLCVPQGHGYMGASGAGHFVKMVHNGIEYGMMQSLAEGFALLKASPFTIDLVRVAAAYHNGSVIESRLTGWLEEGLRKEGNELDRVSGTVGATGEGAWAVGAGKEFGVPTPVIEAALNFRTESLAHPGFTGKILSLLRNQFGGHDMRGG